jgi:glutaredoxin
MDAEAKRTWRWISIILAFCAILGAYLYFSNLPPPYGKYDAFARCIADTSTTFYGAWWCPHCQAQKTEFGDAAKDLPYVECSNSDGSEKQSCTEIGITSYPTWYFPGGASSTGVQSLATLSKETGCALPTST